MLNNPVDNEVPQIRRLQEWWLELPLSYRVNALLYLGGALLAIFLLVTMLAGGDSKPREVQVGAAGTAPTTTAKPRTPAAPPSTAAGATTSSSPTTALTTTTTLSLASRAAVPASGTTGGGGGTTGGGGGTTGGGGGGGGSDTTTTTEPPASSTTTPTTADVQPCRNSQESRCGNFSWDPSPAQNQPLTVQVIVKTPSPKVGQPMVFEVTVNDPDHLVNENCSEVRYGDGGNGDGPCSPPPECPGHYGPWTPPERKNGTYTHEYTHTYQGAAIFQASFRFRSWSPDRCLGLDPYASENTRSVDVTVAVS